MHLCSLPLKAVFAVPDCITALMYCSGISWVADARVVHDPLVTCQMLMWPIHLLALLLSYPTHHPDTLAPVSSTLLLMRSRRRSEEWM